MVSAITPAPINPRVQFCDIIRLRPLPILSLKPLGRTHKEKAHLEYRNPKPTVDVILHSEGQIVLIKRRNPPYGWALPGGYVDEGEWIEDAARREILEETNLKAQLQTLFYVYSDPRRDPRHHTLSIVFIGTAKGEPVAGDDAAEAAYFPLKDLPSPIAFDHHKIIQDYQTFLDTGHRPSPEKN